MGAGRLPRHERARVMSRGVQPEANGEVRARDCMSCEVATTRSKDALGVQEGRHTRGDWSYSSRERNEGPEG
jgi:hypothetical protein